MASTVHDTVTENQLLIGWPVYRMLDDECNDASGIQLMFVFFSFRYEVRWRKSSDCVTLNSPFSFYFFDCKPCSSSTWSS
jgi:hypothetical protein